MALVQMNSRARINAFLDLFLKPPPPLPHLTPEQFLTDISPKLSSIPSTSAPINYIPRLKPYPKTELLFDKTKPIGEGAYGIVYETLDGNYILKFIILGPPPTTPAEEGEYIALNRSIIKEVFIQHYLQSDPESHINGTIPKVHGIYMANKSRGIIVIQMEKLDMTVDKLWKDLVAANPDRKLPFGNMKDFLTNLISGLQQLYNKYMFSHRDLKLDNIMLTVPDGYMKFIDFGMSALTVNLDGALYRIVNDDNYLYDITCSPKQDLGILFTYIYEYYYIPGFLDTKCIKLLNKLFTGNKNSPINDIAKQTPGTFIHKLKSKHNINITRKPGAPLWHSAYNFMGNLYPDTCPISNAFSLENVSRTLTEVETSAGGGRKRRKTQRRR